MLPWSAQRSVEGPGHHGGECLLSLSLFLSLEDSQNKNPFGSLFKINPTKESNPEVLAANVARLESYCRQILKAIDSCRTLVALPLRRMAHFIKTKASLISPPSLSLLPPFIYFHFLRAG